MSDDVRHQDLRDESFFSQPSSPREQRAMAAAAQTAARADVPSPTSHVQRTGASGTVVADGILVTSSQDVPRPDIESPSARLRSLYGGRT